MTCPKIARLWGMLLLLVAVPPVLLPLSTHAFTMIAMEVTEDINTKFTSVVLTDRCCTFNDVTYNHLLTWLLAPPPVERYFDAVPAPLSLALTGSGFILLGWKLKKRRRARETAAV